MKKRRLSGQRVHLPAPLVFLRRDLGGSFNRRIFVTLIITCSLAIPGYWDFLWTDVYIYIYMYVHSAIYWRAHLPVGVLNVVIHDGRGTTSPRSISIGNSVRPANFGVCYRRRRIFDSHLFLASS